MSPLKQQPFKTSIQTLRTIINKTKQANSTRLPTMHELADMAGVSYQTMWSAVRHLKDEGILDVNQRHGIRIIEGGKKSKPALTNENTKKNSPSVRHGQKWENLYQQIEQDIFHGVFKYEKSLPSTKVLADTYHVSYPTLRKALAALEGKKLITREYKKYRVALYKQFHPKTLKILLLTRGTVTIANSPKIMFGQQQLTLLPMLEYECSRQNVGLQPFVFDIDSGILSSIHNQIITFKQAITDADVAGLLIIGLLLGGKECEKLIDLLASVNKPISYLNIYTRDAVPEKLRRKKLFQTFPMAISRQSGIDTGYFLINLGHKKVAYINLFSKSEWSNERLSGLQIAYQSAGSGINVNPVIMSLPETWDINTSLYENISKGKLSERARTVLMEQSQALRIDHYLPIAGPFLESLSKETAITAWVAANDLAAIVCYEWLQQHGISVPGQISLIGIDDSEECIAQNISMYNFNATDYMHAMISFIIWKTPLGKNTANEVPGYIIERGTTTQARTG